MIVNTIYDEALRAGEAVNDVRVEAREDALRALRLLEARLLAVLGGGVLRGLPNLALGCERPWRGVDVRGRAPDRPLSDGPRLVLSERGELVLAWREAGVAEWEPAHDDELLIEDVARAAAAAEWALRRHVERSERLRLEYALAGDLARRLGSVLAA